MIAGGMVASRNPATQTKCPKRTPCRRASPLLASKWQCRLFCTLMVVALPSIGRCVEASHGKPKRSQPAATARTSPDTTGTVPLKNMPGKTGAVPLSPSTRLSNLPDPAAPDVDPLPTLFELPAASRSRMRLCGERWHHMKLDGEAHDEIWRDFASTCLVAKDADSDTARNIVPPRPGDVPNGLEINKQR